VLFPVVLASSAAIGLLINALSAVVVGGVPAAQLAAGTSMSVIARAAGAIVSLSALALILSAVRGSTHAPLAYHVAWAAMTAIAVAAAAAAARGLRMQAEPVGQVR
jgi:hypothetical protein